MPLERLAIVSDIHGNAVALDAVIDQLNADGVERVICLGDALQGGAQPAAVAERLNATGWPVVLGNADAFLLDEHASSEVPTESQLATREWTRAQLGSVGLELITAFQPTIETNVGPATVLAFHGSPASYDDILLPTDDEDDYRKKLGPVSASLVTGGHVHLQYVRRIGETRFVNPGSVGLGYDHEQDPEDFRFDPCASYAIVSTDGARQDVSFRRIPFDRDEVIAAISESGIPSGEELVRQWSLRPASDPSRL
jgi:predicted phosphodiesterase